MNKRYAVVAWFSGDKPEGAWQEHNLTRKAEAQKIMRDLCRQYERSMSRTAEVEVKDVGQDRREATVYSHGKAVCCAAWWIETHEFVDFDQLVKEGA